MDILESKTCYNVIPSVYYFYIKTNVLADFQICISAPLSFGKFSAIYIFAFPSITKLQAFNLQIATLLKIMCRNVFSTNLCKNDGVKPNV